MFFALGCGGITRSHFYPPIQAQSFDSPFGGQTNFFGQSPDGSDPYKLKPGVLLVGDSIEQDRNDQRIGLATAGGGIDQTRPSRKIGQPGLMLEIKDLPPIGIKPLVGGGYVDSWLQLVYWMIELQY